jgi:hypothetical protein
MSFLAGGKAGRVAAGVRNLIRHNYKNFSSASLPVRLVVVAGTLFALSLIWYVMETRGESRGIEAHCKVKCEPLAYRIDRVLLNPFAGEAARRNVREVRCVCGSAP